MLEALREVVSKSLVHHVIKESLLEILLETCLNQPESGFTLYCRLLLENVLIFLDFRHGAEVLEKGASTSTKGNQTFKGTGYRLGQSEEDTQGSLPLPLP